MMKNENIELYQETFSEVHASDELKGKVKDMINNKKALRTATFKKCAAVAALAAIVFASSNVVTYAATGETWVKMVTVNINGKKLQTPQEKKTDSEGNTYYESNTEITEDGQKYKVQTRTYEDGCEAQVIVNEDTAGDYNMNVESQIDDKTKGISIIIDDEPGTEQ